MTVYRIEKYELHTSGRSILTVRSIPGWFRRLFGARGRLEEYIGGGTVWYKYPEIRRVSMFMESMLSEFQTQCEIRLEETGTYKPPPI